MLGSVSQQIAHPSVSKFSIGEIDGKLSGTSLEGARIQIFRSFQECEETWRQAVEQCSCFAFQTFEWQSTWYSTIGKAIGVSAYIVHLQDQAGRTLMILPLGIYRQKGIRFLRFLGGIVTDYNVPLIDHAFADRVSPAELSRFWVHMLELLPRVDVVWLRRMPDKIEGTKNPLVSLSGAMHTENAHAATLLKNHSAFKEARRPKLFSDSRRCRRRLAEKGRIDIHIPAVQEEVKDVLYTMMRQKARQYRERGGHDLFQLPGYRQFYETLTTTPFQIGGIHLSCLRLDNQILSTHWGLAFKGRFYWLMPGYESGEWARYSLGRLLLEDVVEWCAAEGFQVFDLTVGDESFKLDWADHSLALFEYIVPRTIKGEIFLGLRALRQRLKLNPTIRKLARGARSRLKIRFARPF